VQKRTRPKTPEERRKWKCNPDLDVSITLQETDENLELILRKLAHKQMSPGEWKKLAHLWAFTDEQIKAIEHQYIGDNQKIFLPLSLCPLLLRLPSNYSWSATFVLNLHLFTVFHIPYAPAAFISFTIVSNHLFFGLLLLPLLFSSMLG